MIGDYTAARFYLDLSQFALTGAIGVYVWWTNREKVNSKRFEALEKEVAHRATAAEVADLRAQQTVSCKLHTARTAQLEGNFIELRADLKNAPSHNNLSRIHDRIDALTKEVGSIAGSLGGINRAVDLINEHLIKKGGDR